MCEGIDKTYTCWTYHSEKKGEYNLSNLNPNYQFIDGVDTNFMADVEGSYSSNKSDPNMVNEELRDHLDTNERLKDDVSLPFWLGCKKASKLSDVLTLDNLKVGHQISDMFFTKMLTTFSELLPDGNVIPHKIYEAKK